MNELYFKGKSISHSRAWTSVQKRNEGKAFAPLQRIGMLVVTDVDVFVFNTGPEGSQNISECSLQLGVLNLGGSTSPLFTTPRILGI